MILVDKALQARAEAGNPIKVGMIGAGFMGRGIANQIINSVSGIRLAAIYSRDPENARRAYREAGAEDFLAVESLSKIDEAVAKGRFAITEDPDLICQASGIEAIIEV